MTKISRIPTLVTKKEIRVWVSNDLTHAAFEEPGTAQEMRFAQTICALADKDADSLSNYSVIISPTWFAAIFDIAPNNVRANFKKIAHRLGRRTMFPVDRPNLALKWFASMEYLGDAGIKIYYSPELHPYLCGVKNYFTAFNILDTEGLSSFYSIRLHWILSSWANSKDAEDGVYQSIDELRSKFGCKDKYNLSSSFIRRAVEEPVEDINKNAKDISVDFKLDKVKEKGPPKIVGVWFYVRRKKDLPAPVGDVDIELIAEMKRAGCNSQEIRQYLSTLSKEEVNKRWLYFLSFDRKKIRKTELALLRWVMTQEPGFEFSASVDKQRSISNKTPKKIKEQGIEEQENKNIDILIKKREEVLAEYIKKHIHDDDFIRLVDKFSVSEEWDRAQLFLKMIRIDSAKTSVSSLIVSHPMVLGLFKLFLKNTNSGLVELIWQK